MNYCIAFCCMLTLAKHANPYVLYCAQHATLQRKTEAAASRSKQNRKRDCTKTINIALTGLVAGINCGERSHISHHTVQVHILQYIVQVGATSTKLLIATITVDQFVNC